MSKQYCDCKEQLIFEERISILDQYENKLLVCNKYYCPKCGNEYEINEEIRKEDNNNEM